LTIKTRKYFRVSCIPIIFIKLFAKTTENSKMQENKIFSSFYRRKIGKIRRKTRKYYFDEKS